MSGRDRDPRPNAVAMSASAMPPVIAPGRAELAAEQRERAHHARDRAEQAEQRRERDHGVEHRDAAPEPLELLGLRVEQRVRERLLLVRRARSQRAHDEVLATLRRCGPRRRRRPSRATPRSSSSVFGLRRRFTISRKKTRSSTTPSARIDATSSGHMIGPPFSKMWKRFVFWTSALRAAPRDGSSGSVPFPALDQRPDAVLDLALERPDERVRRARLRRRRRRRCRRSRLEERHRADDRVLALGDDARGSTATPGNVMPPIDVEQPLHREVDELDLAVELLLRSRGPCPRSPASPSRSPSRSTASRSSGSSSRTCARIRRAGCRCRRARPGAP